MASIVKRGAFQYQVSIRRKGYPTQIKTFERKRDAEAWAQTIESEMARGIFIDRTEAEQTTLKAALEKYSSKVTPSKKGKAQEVARINRLLRNPLAERSLASLKSSDFADYRDDRLEEVSGNTVRLELALISNLFNVAKKDWSIPVSNPIEGIRKPKCGKPRGRRLLGDEEARLIAATERSLAPSLKLCIQLAIETGMRAGELVDLKWEQIDLSASVITLPTTKNDDARVVPLSEAAEQLVRAQPRPLRGGRLTRFHDSNGLSAAFRRCCKRAGIDNLRFHDLRHESASRMAPRMPVATLAKVFGWKTIQMAMRYYNPTANELVAAVRGLKAA